MKKKVLLILTFVFIFCGSLFVYHNYKGQIKFYFLKPHLIVWKKDIKLKPEDFTGKIDLKSNSNISTFIGFYLYSTNLKDAEVKACFHKKNSWIKDTVNFSNKMEFQKLRFDLYEYYSRKFNIKVQKMKSDENKDLNDMKQIGDQIYQEVKAIDDSIYFSSKKYDIRKRWRSKLDKELNLR